MPLTTAGEEKSTRSPMTPVHDGPMKIALLLLIVFSNGFTPARKGPFLNDDQLVRTLKVLEEVAPLVLAAAGCPGE